MKAKKFTGFLNGKSGGKSRDGSAMVAVICVMMVIAALSFSLLTASYALIAAGRRSFSDQRCRIMAESVSRQIDRELTDKFYSGIPSGLPEDDSLWGYAGALCGEEGEKQTFCLDSENNESWPKEAGRVTVSLYWICGKGSRREAGEKNKAEEETKTGYREEAFRERDLELHVEITCTNEEGACSLTNIYHKVNGEEENSWKWSGFVERE